MIRNTIVVFLLSFCLSACTMVVPSWSYRAPFDPDKTEEVIDIMKDIAHEWNLQYKVDTGRDMQFLTDGTKAFHMFLYFEDYGIISIGNVGVGKILSLMVVDKGDMPIEDLNRLKEDIINTLNERADIKFKLHSKPKKDEPYFTL